MTTYLTESRKTYTNPGNLNDPMIGQEILTITLWAQGERIQTFGGMLNQDEAEVRSKALAAAIKWDGTTAAEIKSYDEFVRSL